MVHTAIINPSHRVKFPATAVLSSNRRVAERRWEREHLGGFDWSGMLTTAANIGMTNLQARRAEAEARLAEANAAAQRSMATSPDTKKSGGFPLAPLLIGGAGLALIGFLMFRK